MLAIDSIRAGSFGASKNSPMPSVQHKDRISPPVDCAMLARGASRPITESISSTTSSAVIPSMVSDKPSRLRWKSVMPSAFSSRSILERIVFTDKLCLAAALLKLRSGAMDRKKFKSSQFSIANSKQFAVIEVNTSFKFLDASALRGTADIQENFSKVYVQPITCLRS
ncbi:MAG: hypothetical protein U1E64_13930 [Sphingomonadaceae bacterium]